VGGGCAGGSNEANLGPPRPDPVPTVSVSKRGRPLAEVRQVTALTSQRGRGGAQQWCRRGAG